MQSATVVCFDIGGVLVKIHHSWNLAAQAAGITSKALEEEVRLNDFAPLLEYQEGSMDEPTYRQHVEQWLNIPPGQALLVHRSVIIGDYPGAKDLIDELKEKGIWTCCFSNTNALHWPVLTDPKYHPAVAALDKKFASHDVAMAKPDVAAYQTVEARFPPHDRVIFFDDTLENIYGARDAGWEPYRLDPKQDPVQEARSILRALHLL